MTNRKPTIFHFNPTCEIAIANGSPYYVPSVLLRQFEEDLAPLMMIFAAPDDIVISHTPPEQWVDSMAKAGFTLPNFMLLDDLKANFSVFSSEGVKLESWGRSPAESQLFQFLGEDNQVWKDEYRAIFERKTAVEFHRQLLVAYPQCEYIDPNISPKIVTSEIEVEKLLESSAPIVLKAPLSSSGRGLAVLRRNKLNDSNRQWIGGILEQQRYLIAEPWLNKQLDLSLQFQIDSNGRVSYSGPSFFQTNTNGQYSGHELNFDEWSRVPGGQETVEELSQYIQRELERSVYSRYHTGLLGIDMITYTNTKGKLKIQPCIEVNPRYTMGYLSQQLEKKIHNEAKGVFRIHFAPKGNLTTFIKRSLKENPSILQDGVPLKGFFCLTPVSDKSKFCAFMELF